MIMNKSQAAPSGYTELILDKPLANGHVNSKKWLLDDIEINHTKIDYTGFGSSFANDKNDMVRLHFTIAGNYNFFHKQLNQSFDISKGQHNIMCTQGMDLTINNQSSHIETLGINFPKSMFYNFLQDESNALKLFGERLVNGQNIILSQKWAFTNAPIQRVIYEILNCQFAGELKKLFLVSKSIELLVLQIAAITADNQSFKKIIKTSGDKEKIYAARDFILSRLSDPPSLIEVARYVGTNEYKLKKGFKEVFNTTVLGLLNNHRLESAFQSLTEMQKTASEIAYDLGYSSPQHFSKAFKNKFGVPPMGIKSSQ